MAVLLWVSVSAYFLHAHREPSQPFVSTVFFLVKTFGAILAVGLPLAAWVIEAFLGSPRSVVAAMIQALRGVAFWAVALWLLGAVGDQVYAAALADPSLAAVIAAAAAIIWTVVSRAMRPAPEPRLIAWSAGARPLQPRVGAKLSARDRAHTSVHEAGHVLVYAALGDLPRGARVTAAVMSSPTACGMLGGVTPIDSGHCLDQPTFVEWRMLVMLAGKRAEMAVHGVATMGSVSDQEAWLDDARTYLANHSRGIYYSKPANELELQRNEAQLEALHIEQVAMLDALFADNDAILHALAQALLQAGSMDREALMPFLARVKLPPTFPRPFGEFEAFGDPLRLVAVGAQG